MTARVMQEGIGIRVPVLESNCVIEGDSDMVDVDSGEDA
jgi:hypothetical protein